jgi:hypothetical protein
VTFGVAGGDGGGDGGGGGGLTLGVATVVVGTAGVATVVVGTPGNDGVATVVVGSEGVVTVVVGSCPRAPPANSNADAKPIPISARTPAVPAARRPPSHTDRTTGLYPALWPF